MVILITSMPAVDRAHHQLGFFSGGYTGTAGIKPLRFGISTFGRLWASMIIADASRLSEHRIGYAPIASNPPGLDHVGVNGAYRLVPILFGDAPVLVQLELRGLDFTLIIGATRHEHRLFSVPSPVKSK